MRYTRSKRHSSNSDERPQCKALALAYQMCKKITLEKRCRKNKQQNSDNERKHLALNKQLRYRLFLKTKNENDQLIVNA